MFGNRLWGVKADIWTLAKQVRRSFAALAEGQVVVGSVTMLTRQVADGRRGGFGRPIGRSASHELDGLGSNQISVCSEISSASSTSMPR